MTVGIRVVCLALVIGTGLVLLAATSATAAQGTLEASVVECAEIDGGLQATVGVSVAGALPGMPVYARITDAGPPPTVKHPPLLIGTTDATGTASTRVLIGGAELFPLSVIALDGDDTVEKDVEQIGVLVSVEFVCPVLKPQDVVDAAVASGVLSEREATPLAVKLGAAATQEAAGNLQAAVNLLTAARRQLDALVGSHRLSSTDAQALYRAIDAELARLNGLP